MKICPCCKSLAFDDIDRCYECMRPFSSVTLANLPEINVLEEPSQTLNFADSIPNSCFGIRSFNISFAQSNAPLFSKNIDESKRELSIGRARDNDAILYNLQVSRHHAKLFLDRGELWVTDLGSKNLTYLDGAPVIGTRKVSLDSVILIGDTKIKVSAL